MSDQHSFRDDIHGLGDWRLDDPNPPSSGGRLGTAYARMQQRDKDLYTTKLELVVRLAVKILGWRVVTGVVGRVRADATLAGR